MLVIGGSQSSSEVRELAEYPSHGGSQGFKSPHLHPYNSPGHRPGGSPPPGRGRSRISPAGSKRAARARRSRDGLRLGDPRCVRLPGDRNDGRGSTVIWRWLRRAGSGRSRQPRLGQGHGTRPPAAPRHAGPELAAVPRLPAPFLDGTGYEDRVLDTEPSAAVRELRPWRHEPVAQDVNERLLALMTLNQEVWTN
jgi:hypothetical protein